MEKVDFIHVQGSETTGQRIAKYRKKRGLTQKQLAEILGINRTLVTDYEIGRARIYDGMIAKIAIALKVSSDLLLGIEQLEEKTPKISLRFAKRLAVIEAFPEAKKKHIVKMLDDNIKANS